MELRLQGEVKYGGIVVSINVPTVIKHSKLTCSTYNTGIVFKGDSDNSTIFIENTSFLRVNVDFEDVRPYLRNVHISNARVIQFQRCLNLIAKSVNFYSRLYVRLTNCQNVRIRQCIVQDQLGMYDCDDVVISDSMTGFFRIQHSKCELVDCEVERMFTYEIHISNGSIVSINDKVIDYDYEGGL
eukprot:TRINITY_DN3595_c0_g2_i1.p1 TRINITY_DN3595_c0_g2~~TRINITY_DN3595_c0_g2_i1.p1  ORF type:complete len:185 (-),score=2.08 TRINITY_DN3595_c0_g2_i1:343-897(-)